MTYPPIEITATERNEMVMYFIKKLKLKYVKLDYELPVADYRIGNIHIELKASINDAVSSIEKNRMNNQAFDLSANLRAAFIVILGNPQVELQDLGFKLNSFIAQMVSLSLRVANAGVMGHINLVTLYSELEFVLWLKHIQKRATNFTPREPLAEKLRKFSRDPEYSIPFMLEATPGLGPELSKAFLSHFGSVQAVMNAEVEELMEVPKIGKKKAERYYNFWRFDWRDYIYQSTQVFDDEQLEKVFQDKEN